MMIQRKTGITLLLAASLIFCSCQTQNTTPNQISASSKQESLAENTATANPTAQNAASEYGLTLPSCAQFAKEWKDFIYRDALCRPVFEDSLFYMLSEKDGLERDLSVRFYYKEADVKEMDECPHNYYDIVVILPATDCSFYSFTYNARGLSSDYEYGYDPWFEESAADMDDSTTAKEVESNSWFQKHYSALGEKRLFFSLDELKTYMPTDSFLPGEKTAILKSLRKEIQTQYKDAANLAVYIYDFLPGDETISGKVVNMHMTSKNDVPLLRVCAKILYSDEQNMKDFDKVVWQTRDSTAYSGAGGNYHPTTAKLKKWAKKEKCAAEQENSVLSCKIVGGKIIASKTKTYNASGSRKSTVTTHGNTASIKTHKTVKRFASKKGKKPVKAVYRYDEPVLSGHSPQIQKINLSLKKAYQKDRKQHKNIVMRTAREIAKDGVSDVTVYAMTTCALSHCTKNRIGFRYVIDWYAYGVHNCFHYGISYDLSTGEKLSLKDVISGTKKQIKTKVWHAYRKKYPKYLSKNSRKSFLKIPLSWYQFYLDNDNVVISFGAYGPFGGNGEMPVRLPMSR